MLNRHTIAPIYDAFSKILILGSFPSVISRAENFYYANPQNRFFSVISAIYNAEFPKNVKEKKKLLLMNNIALWDVIAQCEIDGSSDSSIKNATPNDLSCILTSTSIERIFTNGKTAGALYDKFLWPITRREAVILPSTSPANAAWSLPRLIEAWSVILNDGFPDKILP
ncbi:MAG: DNA-deoxyinosine glycosylase [Clostridia bacterium]